MGQPADGKTLQLSEAVELVTGLPLKEVYDWLSDHQLNQAAPVDLRRVKPDSALLEEVFLGTRPVQGLADAEVRALHYAVPALDVAGQPGAGVSTATADDVGTIRSGLQKKAAGKWTLKYVCSHASKCSCPYTLELRHPAGSEVVSVWQTAPHQFHDPTSADSQAQLRMHPRLEAMATVMIESGATPTSICTRLNNMVHDPADPLGLGGGTTGLQHFSSARVSIIPRQIYVLIKKLRRAEGLGLTSDVQAMAVLIDELRREGSVLFYQPYKQAGRRSGEQPLVIVMQVSFQARMLDQFGRRLVFMDATFGVNKYGYPLYALVVQDESGRGVPVSFMVCSSDTAEVVEHFLRTSMEGAQAAGDGTFKYKSIMIDKSKTEIAAVDQLVSTGHAEGYLLCYFHFLQDWERFLSSGDAGVPKAERHRIMLALARLAHMQDQAPFKQELAFFILSNSQQHLPVAQRMHSSWVPCAEKWAWWGRLDVLDLQCNTNNLGERNFGLIKYTDLERRAQLTLHELLLALLTKTVPRNIHNRAHMLAGRVTSDQQQREQRAALWVQKLVERGAVVPAADSSTPGLTLVQQGEDAPPVHSCVGDLSCSCGYSAEHVCVHVRAAAEVVGYTHKLRLETAAHLVEAGLIQVDEGTGICTTSTLADITKAVHCRPHEGACTCHGQAQHGICCHLLAAAKLPFFVGAELPMVVQLATPEEASEKKRRTEAAVGAAV
ncbi:hypothetical protein CHLNCDRAFT_140162 [Chlorella variabilis]|uniref:ZSWIM1/3 RNaseH-like domain-containing protein n=1 Tax=Chlorella variabilis TaxID=554065 RepID=E1ZRN6_CHLVA|nr:hypothetical protein CHLNCDRAFT_140162 [Chlorella variabilis]EFN51443.1 hypothetical protein CHLNCDRAFT_140162 [Chlorella variabilis]|eukprot:XP_005843545.1 hypothetical protein CHLNCDRAFT_140162 [Chlorella variabilis]